MPIAASMVKAPLRPLITGISRGRSIVLDVVDRRVRIAEQPCDPFENPLPEGKGDQDENRDDDDNLQSADSLLAVPQTPQHRSHACHLTSFDSESPLV